MKPINIFLLSFYFEDLLCECIEKIHKETKHPHNIIVGDNKSINSNQIRNNIRKYIKKGIVKKGYFYKENETRFVEHMLFNEPKSKYSVLCDGDALLPEMNNCWLTRFIEKMEEDKKIGVIGFSSENGPIINSAPVPPIKDKEFSSKKGHDGVLFRAHFMTMRTNLFKDYFIKNTDKPSSDGNIQRHIVKSGYKRIRYDKFSVVNGSERYCDKHYRNIRINVGWAKNWKRKPICKFEIVTKENL